MNLGLFFFNIQKGLGCISTARIKTRREETLRYVRNCCQLIPTTADSFERSFKGRNVSDKNTRLHSHAWNTKQGGLRT